MDSSLNALFTLPHINVMFSQKTKLLLYNNNQNKEKYNESN